MKRINKLKIVTVVLMVVLIMFSAKASFAQTIPTISNSTGNEANNTPVNNVVPNVVPENNTPVNNTPANIPETGKESSTGIFVLIALTSVSAMYTYVKVRKYNI